MKYAKQVRWTEKGGPGISNKIEKLTKGGDEDSEDSRAGMKNLAREIDRGRRSEGRIHPTGIIINCEHLGETVKLRSSADRKNPVLAVEIPGICLTRAIKINGVVVSITDTGTSAFFLRGKSVPFPNLSFCLPPSFCAVQCVRKKNSLHYLVPLNYSYSIS